MAIRTIDVALFRKMVMNGAINLKNNQKEIDELNVFPVPDGDTGTNMSMTVISGVREMNSCESNSIIEVAKVLSRGALMGARGNSGVILSQFFRGLYVGVQGVTSDELSVEDFMKCLESGRQIAYKAVMEPVEGTILTVIREAAENTRAQIKSCKNINQLLELYISEAKKSLDNTPNLLPALKEAGVVDSGGAGFLKIIEGMELAIKGIVLEANEVDVQAKKSAAASVDTDIKFGYCTEFIIELKKPQVFEERDIKAPLSLLGDSLVVVRDENIVKVHVHTNKPGRVLEICQKHGEFVTLKIENMRLQHSELQQGAKTKPVQPRKKSALISVCFGSGIVETFRELGVDYIIEGGQTMNPSTEAFVEAIQNVNADNVIIIPNNGNVVMAAKQAVGLVPDCNVEVLKAKTIAQGYASLMVYDPEASIEENFENMSEAVQNVKSGEVTYSIRDTEIGGVKIKSGDFMGIADGEIVVSTEKRLDALKSLLENTVSEESAVVTFFYGSDAPAEEVEMLEDLVQEINSDCDVQIVEGKQDIYCYIVAVE